jgi:hypothetical protein
MTDIIERMEEESLRLTRLSFDTAGAGIAANVVDDAIAEIKRLRAAIVFWSAARYPEIRPEPRDIEGRIQAQEGLDLAENTLYEIAKEYIPSRT